MSMAYIRARGKQKRLYISFRHFGRSLQEKLDLWCQKKEWKKGCKCQACREAEGFAFEVSRKIKTGKFNYEEYFPNSIHKELFTTVSELSTINFKTYVITWLEYKSKNISHSTLKSYNSILKRTLIPFFGDFKIVDIRPNLVRRYISGLSESPKTIRNLKYCLSAILTDAVIDEIIERNPCKDIQTPRVKSNKLDIFSIDDVEAILKWMEHKHPEIVVFFAIGFFTGMRTGEIMGLKWDDIDFKNNIISVSRTMTEGKEKDSTKTDQDRNIIIIPALERYLNAQKKYTFMQDSFVILNRNKRPFKKYNTITQFYWKPCLKLLGIKYRRQYEMRHTFASLSIEAGMKLNVIRDILGHSDLSMLVKKYGNAISNPVNDTSKIKTLFFGKKIDKFRHIFANLAYPLLNLLILNALFW